MLISTKEINLITLAAGLGTRTVKRSIIPKPFQNVKGNAIIEWSLKSYQYLINKRIIKPHNLYFAILKKHDKLFSLSKKLKFFLIDPYGGCVDIRSNKNFLYKTNLMFDLGKICQSLVSNYEYWKNISIQKSFFNNKEFFIKKRFLPFLNKDFFLLKNVFGKKDKNFINICLMHMIIHLCRLIRYRVKHNYPSALFAYVTATYCINVLVRNDNH